MKNTVVFFLLLLLLSFTDCVEASTTRYTPAAAAAMGRTAIVQFESPDRGWLTAASGFVVRVGWSDYRFYTARHVAMLTDIGELRICATVDPNSCVPLPLPYVGTADWPETMHLVGDWAAWRLEALPDGLIAAQIELREQAVGSSVCTSGAPGGDLGEYTCGGITNRSDGGYVIDARVLPGNSGGPVWNARGKVIGLISALDIPSSLGFPIATRAYVVPATVFWE